MAATTVQEAEREQSRLAALRRYAILDTGAEREFDALAERAARECGYATALISFMDEHRCWFKAVTGLPAGAEHVRELPREQTFCNYAFRSSGTFVVPDARADERFAHLRIVDRPGGYRAYAGTQLITPDGFSIGTLCVLGFEPRTPTRAELDALRALAVRTMALLETRQRDPVPAPPVMLAEPPPRRTVLVVDDDDLVRRFVGALFDRRGVAAILAANGADALAKFRAQRDQIGLVLTDVQMPVMSGYELIRALQVETDAPAIAAMSGCLDDAMRAQLAALRIDCVLAKPFPLAAIDRVLALLPA